MLSSLTHLPPLSCSYLSPTTSASVCSVSEGGRWDWSLPTVVFLFRSETQPWHQNTIPWHRFILSINFHLQYVNCLTEVQRKHWSSWRLPFSRIHTVTHSQLVSLSAGTHTHIDIPVFFFFTVGWKLMKLHEKIHDGSISAFKSTLLIDLIVLYVAVSRWRGVEVSVNKDCLVIFWL